MPDERFGVVVPVGDPRADRADEFADGAVGASFDPLRGEFGEPALDEVEPGAVGRGEVKREARVAYKPALDRRCLVGRGVVEHDVHVEVCWYGGVDQVEETAELLGAMPRRHLGDRVAGGDVDGGAEGRGDAGEVAVG